MSKPRVGNVHQWVLINKRIGDSMLTWNAHQQSWKTTIDPHIMYTRRRITDEILDELLEQNANVEPIVKESIEKKKRGYCFRGPPEELFGPPVYSYFHEHGDDEDTHEMEFRHPGTSQESDIEDDSEVIHNIHYNDLSSPITTIAGQYITSITFAAPPDENHVINRCDMYPAYELQYSIRTDDKRKFLYYDCFEYIPERWYVETDMLPTNKEYRKAMEVLKMGSDRSIWGDSDSEEEDDNSPVELKPNSDRRELRQAKSGVKLFTHAGEFMQSRVYRIQVPLSNICGFRVHSPRNDHEESDDEEESLDEDEEVGDFMFRIEEKQFAREEPQSVLILELQQPASSFAIRRVLSNHKGDNKFRLIEDWSPHKVASRATRHYIVGNKKEINGMASHLAPLLGIKLDNRSVGDNSSGKRGSKKVKKSKMGQKESVDNTDKKNSLIEKKVNLAVTAAPPPLMNTRESIKKKKGASVSNKLTEDDVHMLLKEKCSVQEASLDSVSRCLKKGIQDGYVKLNKGSKTVITKDKCPTCSKSVTCTVGDILYQKDYGGDDMEEGAEGASLWCKDTDKTLDENGDLKEYISKSKYLR